MFDMAKDLLGAGGLDDLLGGKSLAEVQDVITTLPVDKLGGAAIGAMDTLPDDARAQLGGTMLNYFTSDAGSGVMQSVLGSLAGDVGGSGGGAAGGMLGSLLGQAMGGGMGGGLMGQVAGSMASNVVEEMNLPAGMGPIVGKAVAAGLPAVLGQGMANGNANALGGMLTGLMQNGGLGSVVGMFDAAEDDSMSDKLLGGIGSMLGQDQTTIGLAKILTNPLAMQVLKALLPAILKAAS